MTTEYDVFNGDADGILSLIQLRKSNPTAAKLVSGVKRDTQLLRWVPDEATQVTVLDISMEKNTEHVQRLLNNGTKIFYADHHRAGTVPCHPLLSTHISDNSNMCTGLIINQLLSNAFAPWAVAAACGDNLIESAQNLARKIGLSEAQFTQCQQLGHLVNYNGYGDTLSDLHFHPEQLFKQLLAFSEPWHAVADASSQITCLAEHYQQDMEMAHRSEVLYQSDYAKVVMLDNAAWSRRISGVYANACANQDKNKAHVILTHNMNQNFTLSLRAPLNNKVHAGDICAQFSSGGGRAAAGGINDFKETQIADLLEQLAHYYG